MLNFVVYASGPKLFPRWLWRSLTPAPRIWYDDGTEIKLRWFKPVEVGLPAQAKDPKLLYVAASWGPAGQVSLHPADGDSLLYSAPVLPWRPGRVEARIP